MSAHALLIILAHGLLGASVGFQIALANRDYLEVATRLERGEAYRDQFRPHP